MIRPFYPRLFGIAALAALAYGLFRIFEPFLAPILWAVLLAFLLYPINLRLRRRLRGHTGAAAGLLTLGVIVGLTVPAALLTDAFAREATELAARLSAAAGRYRNLQPRDLLRLPTLQSALTWVEQRVPVTSAQVQSWLFEGMRRVLQSVAAASGSLFLGAIGVLANVVLMLFVLFFFLRDGDAMGQRIVRVLPMPEARKQHLTSHLSEVTRAVVFGTLVTAILQGILVGVGFLIIGLPSPVVFGAMAAACSLLPVGGTAFVWGPGAIALAFQGRWGATAFLVLWGALLVSMVDNLLRPYFISGRAQISTLPIFFGVLGGLAAFGPIGMFLGPVLIALALALLGFAEEAASAPLPPREPTDLGVRSG